jgi:hypothetical protein
LEQEDESQRQTLQQIFSANPEATSYLERLESIMGQQTIPPGENIAEEVERFLRNQRRGEGGPTPFSP